ncbi:MAG: flagellar assembly protein T N-terminal domain-containing protein [Deltaproteobacteria bacterium]|nr:flagellar assembly protein T N-terminal domain-containing protein [Deltaproteobacteria bacterium]
MRSALIHCVVLLAPAWVWAQGGGGAARAPGWYQGTGQARIVNEDRVAARQRALEEAMRQAVERAVDGLLGPEVRASRPHEVRGLAGRAHSLIERYRVLAESEAGGLYQVQIEATVDAQRLGAALGRGTTPQPGPGPAVVLRVPGGGDAETLRRALADAGVAVATTAVGREVRVTRVAVDEGEVRGADVWAARVELTAVVTGLGGADVPLAASARRFAANPTAARVAAEQAAATDLAQAVARTIAPAASGGVPVRLVGRFGYRHYRALVQALAASQVPGLEPRRFGHRFVLLWAPTALSPQDLGRRVGQLPVPGLSRVVERADAGEVRVRLEVEGAEAPEGLP